MSDDSPMEEVLVLLRDGRTDALVELLSSVPPSEVAHVVSRLEPGQRAQLLELLPKDAAASLVESLPLALGRDVLDELPPKSAAAILDRLPSDEQTDLLSSLGESHASQVLAQMSPGEAEDVTRLSEFAADTAGGLMATEFLTYREDTSVGQVVADMRARAAEYAQYAVQYVYVQSRDGTLYGVVRLRDLLFHHDDEPLSDLSLRSPVAVQAAASLSDLRNFFERHDFFAAPVVDPSGRLIGIVTRSDYEEAAVDQAARTFMRFSGIVLGEEFRSMPLLNRAGTRLAWLGATMFLSFLAASVVGLFQDTLAQVIALAVFLPVISGMSGNAGNQAIAVTMRELSLGLVMPKEIAWVLAKEASVGVINGILLGTAMALVALVWKGNPLLGVVAGAAQMISILLAACLGGILPLILKRFGVDPAVASAPLLTTVTDATGFFLTLAFAKLLLTS